MYAEGGAEEVVARGHRRAAGGGASSSPRSIRTMPRAAEAAAGAAMRSLKRLKRGAPRPLSAALARRRSAGGDGGGDGAEAVAAGKIARWGVSNLDVDDLEELGPALPDCATDQVLLEPGSIAAWSSTCCPSARARRMPVMAYSPVGQGGAICCGMPALKAIAARHGVRRPAQVALAWTLSRPAGRDRHPQGGGPSPMCGRTRRRATCAWRPRIRRRWMQAFPPPLRKRPLAML
jgi:hypothetical protein